MCGCGLSGLQAGFQSPCWALLVLQHCFSIITRVSINTFAALFLIKINFNSVELAAEEPDETGPPLQLLAAPAWKDFLINLLPLMTSVRFGSGSSRLAKRGPRARRHAASIFIPLMEELAGHQLSECFSLLITGLIH